MLGGTDPGTHGGQPGGGPPALRELVDAPTYAGATFTAAGPFGPCSASYETRAPSASDLKPSPAMPEWWTNRSLPWSSGVMKPKPLSSLNHFTVPVAIVIPPV